MLAAGARGRSRDRGGRRTAATNSGRRRVERRRPDLGAAHRLGRHELPGGAGPARRDGARRRHPGAGRRDVQRRALGTRRGRRRRERDRRRARPTTRPASGCGPGATAATRRPRWRCSTRRPDWPAFRGTDSGEFVARVAERGGAGRRRDGRRTCSATATPRTPARSSTRVDRPAAEHADRTSPSQPGRSRLIGAASRRAWSKVLAGRRKPLSPRRSFTRPSRVAYLAAGRRRPGARTTTTRRRGSPPRPASARRRRRRAASRRRRPRR